MFRYILHTLAEKEILKKRGKLMAFFVDLKAAFDSLDREELMAELKKIGVKGRLLNSIRMIYGRTTNQVRDQGELTEELRSYKGVRQGCPLSPLLFNLYIGGLGKWLENNQAGGVVLGRYKVYLLAYADDMVIIARSAEELQNMMNCVAKYLSKKS